MKSNHLISRASCFLMLSLAVATMHSSVAHGSSTAGYPMLPDLPGADISGAARIVIYLEPSMPLIEVDGQLYTIGDRPLEVAFGQLAAMTVLFVVPEGTGVFVTEDGLWIDELDPSPVSRTLTFDLVDPLDTFGFELALPGQPGPTVPDLVIRPTENDPDPA